MLVGASAIAVFWVVAEYARRRQLRLGWRRWFLTGLVIFYGVFVTLLAIGFLEEGAGQAALVMGLILGVPGVIFCVLLKRFVFNRARG